MMIRLYAFLLCTFGLTTLSVEAQSQPATRVQWGVRIDLQNRSIEASGVGTTDTTITIAYDNSQNDWVDEVEVVAHVSSESSGLYGEVSIDVEIKGSLDNVRRVVDSGVSMSGSVDGPVEHAPNGYPYVGSLGSSASVMGFVPATSNGVWDDGDEYHISAGVLSDSGFMRSDSECPENGGEYRCRGTSVEVDGSGGAHATASVNYGMERFHDTDEPTEDFTVRLRLAVSGSYYPSSGNQDGNLLVLDINRFGRPASGLAGVEIVLNDGTADVAMKVTDASGLADFSDSGLDLTQLYDIRLKRDALARTYQAVRPSELADTTLVLPTTLVRAIDDELALLDASNTVLFGFNNDLFDYDVEGARDVVHDWTGTPQPELTAIHAARDPALARLLIASEGLADVYQSVEPLAEETAAVTVDAFMSVVTIGKVINDIQAATQSNPNAPSLNSVALKLALKATNASLTLFKSSIIGAASAVLPDPAAKWLVKADQVAVKTGGKALSSGAWDQAAARKSLIQQALVTASKEVGGVVLTSGHVIVVQGDLNVAVAQTRQLAGSGTPTDAFQASQNHAIATTASIDQTVDASKVFSSTVKTWNKVADVATVATTVPGFQLVGLFGAILKAFDTGALVAISVNDLYELYDVTFEDAPLVAARAFDPTATASVVFVDPTSINAPTESARRQATAARQVATDAYLDRLDAVIAAIEAEDYDTVVAEAEALLADDDALQAAHEAERLRLIGLAGQALADDDNNQGGVGRVAYRGPFADAFARSTTASTGLIGEQMSFYAALAAYVEPALALPPDGSTEPPFAARDSLLAIAPRLSEAVTTASSSLSDALAMTDGLTAEALVMVPEHGLPDPAGRAGWTAPDQQIPFQARVVNAGDEVATGIEVRLVIDGDTTGGDPAMRVITERMQTVDELAPGAEETLTWWVATRDTSASGTGSAAVYELVTTATSGRVRSAAGGVEITSDAPVSDEAPVALASEVSLRVYPNPTRGASSMQVDLPEPARVRLAVYDALGREVAVALGGERPAGRHTVALATDGLAPGVYVVRLVVGDALATQRLTVVR